MSLLLSLLLIAPVPKYISVQRGYVWTFKTPRAHPENLRGRIGPGGWFRVLGSHGRCKAGGRWLKIHDHAWVCGSLVTHSWEDRSCQQPRDWFAWFRPGPFYQGTGRFTMVAPSRSKLLSGASLRRLRGLRGFLVVSHELSGGRHLLRTFDGLYLFAESARPWPETAAAGITPAKSAVFPLAVVVSKDARLYREAGPIWKEGKVLPQWSWREVVPAGGDTEFVRLRRSRRYAFRRSDIRIAYRPRRPASVGEHERWIHVDLDQNVLCAMEGDRVVRVVPINSGPNTPSGEYRIYWKVLFDTMDRQNVRRPYYVEAVPYVLYFKDDFAIHAAYWQTEFGQASSHGCINVPLHDAAFLFLFTSPALPRGFVDLYTVNPEEGTRVVLVRRHGVTQ